MGVNKKNTGSKNSVDRIVNDSNKEGNDKDLVGKDAGEKDGFVGDTWFCHDAGKMIKDKIDVVYKGNVIHESFTKTIEVEYAWKPPCCSHCRVFSHDEMSCKLSPKEKLWERSVKRPNKKTWNGKEEVLGSNSDVNKEDLIPTSEQRKVVVEFLSKGSDAYERHMIIWNIEIKRYYKDRKELFDVAKELEKEEDIIIENHDDAEECAMKNNSNGVDRNIHIECLVRKRIERIGELKTEKRIVYKNRESIAILHFLDAMPKCRKAFRFSNFITEKKEFLPIVQEHPQPNNNFVPQPSFDANYLQHPMQNLIDISNPTTALDMELEFTSKAFQLNNTTPTNQQPKEVPSNPCYISTECNTDVRKFRLFLCSQEIRGVQNVGNHNGLSVVSEITNRYGNGNLVTTPAEGNGNGINGNQIRCYNCQGMDHHASNCTDNLQQASTSGTQSDKAPVYDSDGSAEVHHSRNCYDNDIFNMFTQKEQQAQQKQQSLYNGKVLLEKHDPPVVFELECKILKLQFLKRKQPNLFRDFKSLATEADESIAREALELEIERLLRAVVSQDIMSIVQNPSVVDTSNLQTELDRTKEL
ncbi:hypothetical protein Tco_0723569 [Tanacetum coccineum]